MKNKSEPLRGKEKCRYEKSHDGTHCDDAYICFDAKDVVSACKFYHYYQDSYDRFSKDYTHILKGKMYIWMNAHNFDNEDEQCNEFNCWLFDWCFADVIK